MWKRVKHVTKHGFKELRYVNDDPKFSGVIIVKWWKGRYALEVDGETMLTARTLLAAKFHAQHEADLRAMPASYPSHPFSS